MDFVFRQGDYSTKRNGVQSLNRPVLCRQHKNSIPMVENKIQAIN